MTAVATPARFTLFGRYLLLERLAVGGMAEVYLAKRLEASGEVSDLLAVKRILPSLAEDGGFIRMFLDEARIAGRLHHPGIVRIRELGRIGESHYLVMDYVWGKDLLAIIRRCRLLGTRLSPSFVALVGAQMCEALHAAHAARDRHGEPMRVIHRDVSPQNVLVSFDGEVKLIDFGIAKAQARLSQTQSGLLKGKIGYMSPEQVASGEVDHRSDLFAVGTCMYELLTLRALFARENSFDAMENVRSAEVAPVRTLRSDVPEALEAILAKALSRDPDARWSSGLEMHRALTELLASHDPGYDRVAAVSWIRDAFHKELHLERRRLDAFDLLGRPQVLPTDAPRRNSITELTIASEETAIDGWEDTEATSRPDAGLTPLPSPEPDDSPTEVYFTAPPSEPPGPNTAPLDAPTDPELPQGQDVAVDPGRVSSGMIARLAPPPADDTEERAQSAREPTVRSPAVKPKAAKRGGWGLRIAAGLLMLVLGAGGTFAWLSFGATARVEIRTAPSIGAVVLFDGVSQGPAPVALENVEPGHHVLTIVAPGYEDVTREIEVRGNSTSQIDVALRAVHPAP